MAGITIGQLEAKIKSVINKALNGPIAEDLKEDLTIHAQTDVYDAYEPKRYVRRFTLTSPSTYIQQSEGDMKVSVDSRAQFNRLYGGDNYGDELPGFMNYGDGWHGYAFNYSANPGRHYIDNTRDEWENGKFKDKIIAALNVAGFKTK